MKKLRYLEFRHPLLADWLDVVHHYRRFLVLLAVVLAALALLGCAAHRPPGPMPAEVAAKACAAKGGGVDCCIWYSGDVRSCCALMGCEPGEE